MEDITQQRPVIKGKYEQFKYWDFYDHVDDMILKSTVFWGESGVGKSFLLNTYLNAISPKISIMYAFSSTANSDKEFPIKNYTSQLFVKESLSIETIMKITERGRNQMLMFEHANNIDNQRETTEAIILPTYREHNMSHYDKTKRAFNRIKKQEKQLKSKDLDLNERREISTHIKKLYRILMYKFKLFIRKHGITFDKAQITLLYPIIFCDLRPSTLMFFNDVSSEAKSLKGEEKVIYGDLHTKERHFGNTVVWALHNTIFMPKEIRSQIKFHVFISSNTLLSFISNNNIIGNLKKRLENACEVILIADKAKPKEMRKYNVVIYDKLNDGIYYTSADAKLEQDFVGKSSIYNSLQEYVADPYLDNNNLIEIFQ